MELKDTGMDEQSQYWIGKGLTPRVLEGALMVSGKYTREVCESFGATLEDARYLASRWGVDGQERIS